MKASLRGKLDGLAARLAELNGLLAAESATRDMEQFRKLSREHSELSGLVSLYDRFCQAERDAAAARDMALDPETRSFAEDELKEARTTMDRLERELQQVLLPRDPNDERNTFLEIRAGTGGDAAGRARPRAARVGALASRQSEPLASRAELEARGAELLAQRVDDEELALAAVAAALAEDAARRVPRAAPPGAAGAGGAGAGAGSAWLQAARSEAVA